MAVHNRLKDNGGVRTTRTHTIRIDHRFDRVMKVLMKSGHSSFAECIYDAVYTRANALNPNLKLPTITKWNDDIELELEMVDELAESLGVLQGIITNNYLRNEDQ